MAERLVQLAPKLEVLSVHSKVLKLQAEHSFAASRLGAAGCGDFLRALKLIFIRYTGAQGMCPSNKTSVLKPNVSHNPWRRALIVS